MHSIPTMFRNPTRFMIDIESPRGRQDTLQDYIKREPGYDLAFCRAWSAIDTIKDQQVTHSAQFLALLDTIQKCALSHLPKIRKIDENHYYDIQGRADENHFGLSENINSDAAGIRDIIKKIWIEQDDFELIIHYDEVEKTYLLNKREIVVIYHRDESGAIVEKHDPVTHQESFEELSNLLLPLYHKGRCPNGSDRMVIYNKTTIIEREKKALKIINDYFKEIEQKKSSIEKIRTIASTIRDLMQLHLYYDGNGRSLYILANLLFYQNGLPLFYPRNMCMFDGNSSERMVEEILAGQERFALMFGSYTDLTNGLKSYEETVVYLKKIIDDNVQHSPILKKTVEERNFNLLLRKAASDAKNNDVFLFLLNNLEILSIDLFAKGETSGTALDVARKFNNIDAVRLLTQRGLH